MTRKFSLGLVLVLAGGMLVAGCGQGGDGSATTIPATPDGTVKAVADSLAKNQPRVAWDAMPAKWQGDVSGLVHGFAQKMDAEVYDKGFVVAGKLSEVLARQKKLVLELAADPQLGGMVPVKRAELEANYDTIVSFLGTVAKSDAATLDGLGKLDIGKFLGTTGSKLMADMDRLAELAPAPPGRPNDYKANKAKLAGVKVEVIESTDTTARLKITSGDDAEEVEMVKVEDRWVPRDVADGWDAKVADARADLAEMTGEAMAQSKLQALAILNSVDTGLTAMGKAQTKEELQQAVMGVVGSIMQQMMAGGQ